MKILSVVSRYRLLVNILALTLALGVLASSPVAADEYVVPEGGGWTCEAGCWAWNAEQGCTREVMCCSHSDGRWFCVE
jgi:hypothetical protein